MELERLIQGMDIPETRRDITKGENLRWLSRNLGIRNSDHPNLAAAEAEIRKLLKSLR